MFKKIKLKNFKSLIDFSVDLTTKTNKAKKLIVIYGENGVGKSNLVSAFNFLLEISGTREYKKMLEKIIEEKDFDITFLNKNILDTKSIIKNNKTIGSIDNMSLEFVFTINNNDYTYYIETTDEVICREKLSYTTRTSEVVLFDLSNDYKVFNKCYTDKKYESTLKNQIDSLWGRHSITSILYYELNDKNKNFIDSKLNVKLKEVLNFINSCSLKNVSVRNESNIFSGNETLPNLIEGYITLDKKNILNKTEEFLNRFFIQLYRDIKKVYYVVKEDSKGIYYKLYLTKILYAKEIDIDFNLESYGTIKLLENIEFLLSSTNNNVAVIDEVDNGVHDLLMDTIVDNLYDQINGQLIITTHNTLLLESHKLKDAIYFFNIDDEGCKKLTSLSAFETRVQKNLNIRKRYLSGMYGGIPTTKLIRFKDF